MRIPLYAKILVWFFLNLLVLAATGWLLFGAQFRPGLDTLISGRAGDHIQMVANLIINEMHSNGHEKWDADLKRFGDAYHVRFYVFTNDGEQLAGSRITLPNDVRTRLTEKSPGPPPAQNPPGNEFAPPFDNHPPADRPPPFSGNPPGSDGPPPGRDTTGKPRPAPRQIIHPKSMVRTSNPTRYWVIVRIPGPRSGPDGRPEPASLITESETINAGGLFFDPIPWLEVAGCAALISALIWLPFVRGITSSITRMTRATGQIAEGHFEVRIAGNRHDELGSLATAINRMAERLAGFVGGQKRFLGDIAHELCSPLARAQMALGVLDQRSDEPQRAYITDVREEIELMSSLVNELLSFSKASLGMRINLQPVDLHSLLEKVIEREASGAAHIEIEMEENLSVIADPELLQRSLANLIRNALHYAGHAGPIQINAATAPGKKVTVIVADNGPGVPADALAQVFDPFYRIDPSRARETGGAGLGLAIVKTCIESCSGTVTARNRHPSGLEVIITLPSA